MYSKRVNKYLHEVYKEYGLNTMCKVARIMLVSDKHKDDKKFRNEVHGEICETVLECCIIDFMENHPKETKQWRLEKGMILKDLSNRTSDFKTEIDITLFTPFKILSFECKCYSGNKTLVDKCTVVRKGVSPSDIYRQHKLHFTMINSNFSKFRIVNEDTSKYGPMQIGFFDFSVGTLSDQRDEKWKKLMPLIDNTTIHELLESYLNKPVCWDMQSVNIALDVINKHKEKNREAHLDYVKKLHNKK